MIIKILCRWAYLFVFWWLVYLNVSLITVEMKQCWVSVAADFYFCYFCVFSRVHFKCRISHSNEISQFFTKTEEDESKHCLQYQNECENTRATSFSMCNHIRIRVFAFGQHFEYNVTQKINSNEAYDCRITLTGERVRNSTHSYTYTYPYCHTHTHPVYKHTNTPLK